MSLLTSQPVPLPVLRTLALHAQALTTPPGAEPDPTLDSLYELVARLGCVQIDTLHMVRRSQYLVLWSRLGTYDPADFDRLIYDPADRRLFEYWQHAASIIPLRHYRYRLDTMRWYANGNGWWPEWRKDPANQALIQSVLDRIRDEGPLRTAQFEDDRDQRGTWWDWKPAKRALEHLYNEGTLMIRERVNFHRVYDLAGRVLPEWVNRSDPGPEETRRFLIEQAARALGVAQPGQIADYAYMKRGEGVPVAGQLATEGVLIPFEGTLLDGRAAPLLIHRDHLPLLEQAADGALSARRTTFLSPFDSLFWARGRDEQLWGFRQRLEAYTPAPKREWGYFCLPILHHDRLVGRFDPKLERKTGTLILRALYLEPGVEPSDDLIADGAGAMRDFLRFHDAQHLVIERSVPAEFGDRLLAAV